MINLFRLIDILAKFAEIPVYNKCKKCGDTDPYLGDEGLCYKCFDPSISKKESKKEPKKYNFPTMSILSRSRASDKIADFNSEILLGKGLYVVACAGNWYHTGCSPISVLTYPNQDVRVEDYDAIELYFTMNPGPLKADLTDLIIDDQIKSLMPYKKHSIDLLSWNNIPTKELQNIISEVVDKLNL